MCVRVFSMSNSKALNIEVIKERRIYYLNKTNDKYWLVTSLLLLVVEPPLPRAWQFRWCYVVKPRGLGAFGGALTHTLPYQVVYEHGAMYEFKWINCPSSQSCFYNLLLPELHIYCTSILFIFTKTYFSMHYLPNLPVW